MTSDEPPRKALLGWKWKAGMNQLAIELSTIESDVAKPLTTLSAYFMMRPTRRPGHAAIPAKPAKELTYDLGMAFNKIGTYDKEDAATERPERGPKLLKLTWLGHAAMLAEPAKEMTHNLEPALEESFSRGTLGVLSLRK